MSRVRRYLLVFALATVAGQAGALVLGALRACLPGTHVHAGVAEPDCPMHHHAGPPADAGRHGHHGHAAPPSNDGRAHLACNCSNDAAAPYVAPNALTVARASFLPPVPVRALLRAGAAAAVESDLTPTSPPPRSRFS
jgi:hypothetical protein